MTTTLIHPMILGFLCEWYTFKDKLPDDQQMDFENLMIQANRHLHPIPDGIFFQQVIMSILLEHEKEINRLRKKLFPYNEDNFS